MNLHHMSAFPVSATAQALADGRVLVVSDCFDITAFSDEDPTEALHAARTLWPEVPLAPRLAAGAAQVRDALGPDATAYHLRPGDIIHDPATFAQAWPDKCAPDEFYDRHIARAVAETALTLAPDQPARRAWRGLMALRDGDSATAFADLLSARDNGLALPGLAAHLAVTARRLRRDDVERRVLDATLALLPGDPQLLRFRADLHLRQG